MKALHDEKQAALDSAYRELEVRDEEINHWKQQCRQQQDGQNVTLERMRSASDHRIRELEKQLSVAGALERF
jgi:hypothetical protein